MKPYEFCLECSRNARIVFAEYTIPALDRIDWENPSLTRISVCGECLKTKSEYQKKNAKKINTDSRVA